MLFLTLESFSKTGGIQNVSRHLAKAFTDLTKEKNAHFRMLSLCDHTIDADSRYVNPNCFRGFKYRKFTFFLVALLNGLKNRTVILSHINLLSVAYFIELLSPGTKIILVAHGKEVWCDLAKWEKRFLGKSIEIWAVSQYTRQVLMKKHAVPEKKVVVLNNCLDPYFKVPLKFSKPTYLLDRYCLNQHDPVVFTMSRLNVHEKNKGYDLVLNCMVELVRNFPSIKYMLSGRADEIEHARLVKRIAELNLDQHVILTGYLPDDELPDHHLLSDVFIMPSTKEGFGLVFLEALVCGAKVIAGNKDGSVDALLNGDIGMLINPESKDEILVAVSTLLKSPRRHEDSIKQQEITIQNFHFDIYKVRIAKLLDI